MANPSLQDLLLHQHPYHSHPEYFQPGPQEACPCHLHILRFSLVPHLWYKADMIQFTFPLLHPDAARA